MSRGLYRIRFRVRSGRDGGFGDTKTFKTSLSSPRDASRRIRTKGAQIISVKLIKRV